MKHLRRLGVGILFVGICVAAVGIAAGLCWLAAHNVVVAVLVLVLGVAYLFGAIIESVKERPYDPW